MTYDPKRHWDDVGRASSPGTGDSPGIFGPYALPAWSATPQWSEYLTSGMRVLDVGSGTGTEVGRMARDGICAVGVDISDSLLLVARENCRLHKIDTAFFVQWNGRDLPFADAIFDCVMTNTVLQHVVDDNTVARIFAEAGRTLKPGGLFLVSELVAPKESIQTAPHMKLRSVAFYASLGNRECLEKVSDSNEPSFYATIQALYGRRRQKTDDLEPKDVSGAKEPHLPAIGTFKKVVSMLAGPIDRLARSTPLGRAFVGQSDIVFRKR